MLQDMIAMFQPHAAAILGDESGAAAERIVAQVVEGLDSATADWLCDNWDSVLDGLTA